MDTDVAGVEGMFQGTYEFVCPFTDYVMCVIGGKKVRTGIQKYCG